MVIILKTQKQRKSKILNRGFFLVFTVFFVVSCTQAKDFSYGQKQINALDSKYNTTMEIYPKNMMQIDSMLGDLAEIKKLQLEAGQEPFNYIINYKKLNLEAEKLYIQGQKYGELGTTKGGFGCKLRPLIIESASFRNNSALKGFEAVNLLREFIKKYQNEAKLANLSEKNALFLNATFYQIANDAKRDSSIINHFCPENITLELYQEEFRKKTNLSEDFINKLKYHEAIKIWKKIRDLE